METTIDQHPNAPTRGPAALTPALACDSHLHLYDPALPSLKPALPNAAVADYRRVRKRLGLQRAVVVTPAVYGTDNQVTLNAIAALGADQTRGVAVLHPDASDATLRVLHEGGVRGLRLTLFDPATAVTRFDMVEPLAQRVQALGWHLQLHWRADQIVEHAALLDSLRCPLVFDHMARLPAAVGSAHPAYAVLSRLLDRGNVWVKLSAPYLNSATPDDDATAALVHMLLERAPERLVWGSDWPHPTERDPKPDDLGLLDLLTRWVPDETQRRRILVDNPAQLYDFASATV